MTVSDLKTMNDDMLGERFRSLMGAYDKACMAYQHARASEIHRAFYAVEDELRTRRGDDWQGTGLETASLEDIVEQFKNCAIAYDYADGSDETEHLYWDLDSAKKELQRRPGDQRRALFSLYTHPDIRIRAAAADATRTLAPLLSRHRQQNIDDKNWAPPASGLDIAEAGIADFFPKRTKRPGKLVAFGVQQLTQRFCDLALAQYHAELRGEIAKQNRLYFQIAAIEQELKSRPGDQRVALLNLYEHSNVQVRLMAAKLTLAVAPKAARELLQGIADSKKYPQAGAAGMCLWALDQGIFKPI